MPRATYALQAFQDMSYVSAPTNVDGSARERVTTTANCPTPDPMDSLASICKKAKVLGGRLWESKKPCEVDKRERKTKRKKSAAEFWVNYDVFAQVHWAGPGVGGVHLANG